MDAISLLKADHRKVEALFKKFENVDNDEAKNALANEIRPRRSVTKKDGCINVFICP